MRQLSSSEEKEEIRKMRVIRQEDRYVAQFTAAWEAAYLLDQPEEEGRWISLYLPGQPQSPIGAIHSQSHEIRLASDVSIADRQLVVLGQEE